MQFLDWLAEKPPRSLGSDPAKALGIFNSPKCDVNPKPNTQGIGSLVGRTVVITVALRTF